MKFLSKYFAPLLCVGSLFVATAASAQFSFEVEDVRLTGLQRVSAGTVFNEISLEVGDVADSMAIRELVRELFETGYFDDIEVTRDEERGSRQSRGATGNRFDHH